MANTRLTVVVRKDLQMPVGLLAAQVAHMSDAFLRYFMVQCFVDLDHAKKVLTPDGQMQKEWCLQPYISVLAVCCLEDLDIIIEHAETSKLETRIWTDTIPSPTFPDRAIKVKVGCSIGPEDFDKIKMVTGGLPRYE